MSAKRLSEMSIDLGDEQIVLERLESMEALSSQFSIMVDVISPLELDLHPHLGKPCGLKILEDDELLRHFHGLLVSGEYVQESSAGHHYRLTLRPWSWFLSQNRQMAIFQDLTAVDIIKRVFGAAGIADYELRLSRQYDTRLYCVQYQESDFAFASRLMEEEGIYYFFRHEAGAHILILCDSPGAHQPGKPARLNSIPTRSRFSPRILRSGEVRANSICIAGPNASQRAPKRGWRSAILTSRRRTSR